MRPPMNFAGAWQRISLEEGASRRPGHEGDGQDHRWSLRMAVISLTGMSLGLWVVVTAVSRLTLG